MSDEEIEAFAAHLEAEVRVEDAKFRLDEIWDENDVMANHIIANREGFLHLAALLLRGAVMEENSISPPLIAFENENAEAFFDKVERREIWLEEPAQKPPTWKGRVGSFLREAGCVVIVIVLLLFFSVGFVTVFSWIFG